ncbi:MAG: hypothetical protein K0V04_22380 [Deltaproteobacteria bacterium]|nr:hypothetical protein [Deltaproteobacteria bacterium]
MTGGGCRPQQRSDPPLCSFELAGDAHEPAPALSPTQWLPIVSPSIDRTRLVRTGPLRDTCGRQLPTTPAAWPACPNAFARTVPRPGGVVDLDDFVLGSVRDGRLLVWAATEDLSTGDGMGPAALVSWTEHGLDVHATGSLSGARDDVRLQVHHSGGIPVVIHRAQRCDADDVCRPVAHLTPIVGRRFREMPVFDPQGQCLGPATFELHRTAEQPTETGSLRRFELHRTIELTPEGIVIVDLVTGQELDPRDPDGSAVPFRRITARRAIELTEDRFVLRDRDLWTHTLRDSGMVRTPAATTAGPP